MERRYAELWGRRLAGSGVHGCAARLFASDHRFGRARPGLGRAWTQRAQSFWRTTIWSQRVQRIQKPLKTESRKLFGLTARSSANLSDQM